MQIKTVKDLYRGVTSHKRVSSFLCSGISVLSTVPMYRRIEMSGYTHDAVEGVKTLQQ